MAMEKEEKSIQKFTQSEININALLDLEVITIEDYKTLSPDEKTDFDNLMINKLNELKAEKNDHFFNKVKFLLNQSTKNQLWEGNHLLITNAIASFMEDYGFMPTKNRIAEKTGLSRATIYKHLKDFTIHPQYLIEVEQFRYMTSKVLAQVFKFALTGDIRAAKLYFEIVGNPMIQPGNNTHIQQQNNYIQINGTVLSQERIRQLTPEQLAQIEVVIKLALPETNKNGLTLKNS
jgi:hypothetical protein